MPLKQHNHQITMRDKIYNIAIKITEQEAGMQEIVMMKNYFKNGNLMWEMPYKPNGVREGITKWFWENGKLQVEALYKNGKREGIERWYHKNGRLRKEVPYKKDKVNGIERGYFENGSLEYEIPYKNDRIDGVAKYYRRNGKLKCEVEYNKGERVKIGA